MNAAVGQSPLRQLCSAGSSGAAVAQAGAVAGMPTCAGLSGRPQMPISGDLRGEESPKSELSQAQLVAL